MKPFLDILYPRSCIGCRKTAPKTFRYICWDCWADTVRVEAPFCACCGDPVSGAVEHDFICYSCSDEQPAFEAARSATRYDGVIGDALRKLKYEHALWLSPDLAAALPVFIAEAHDDDVSLVDQGSRTDGVHLGPFMVLPK